MKYIQLLTVLITLFVVSCSDTQVPPDMSSDISGDMEDAPKDVAQDQQKDVSMDVPTDSSDDFGADTAPDLMDASTDMPPDQSMDMQTSAYRRMCIAEDVQRCVIQNKTQFGDCNQIIGAVFDGHQCVEAKGCEDCKGDDCPMFDSIESCASSCAQNGWCQAGKFPHLPSTECSITTCPQHFAFCVESDQDPADQFKPFGQAMNDVICRPKDASRYCFSARFFCDGDNQWCCHFIRGPGILRSDEFTEACALTLQPNIKQAGCSFVVD